MVMCLLTWSCDVSFACGFQHCHVTRFHTLLRPSVSSPNSMDSSPGHGKNMSLSSLRAILSDELGVSLVSIWVWLLISGTELFSK